jgi:D-alanyl-D-alanine carboxypeptidase
VWGHSGGIPGYSTFAFHDRSGSRSILVMLSTEADEALWSLLQLTIETAICQMFGRVRPAEASTTLRPVNPFIPLRENKFAR